MRISFDWLAEFIDLPDPATLVERFDLCGFEDSAVEAPGPDLSAVRVGHVVEHGPHPNADRLSLCRVDVGEDDPRDIVCGASNVAAGQKVAVALPGTRLPDGTKLKKTKIRGVASHGMICSSVELGLGDDPAGILVLPDDAPVGVPLPEVLGAGERILEVGITPNRGDTASLLGLAREVRALFGGSVRLPDIEPPETGPPASESIRVSIEASDDCHLYAARVVRGVEVGPSPDWVVHRLESAGIRAINNVVDVTNLVLLEFGQPLHGFDLGTLRGGEIRVRAAGDGEKFAALDGETRELDPGDLVIADAERAIALAGVMGGADTEVSQKTRDVLIESAHFHPKAVRMSARRHGLRTEASYRFERGVDREGVIRAADRAARLLSEIAGGEVAEGVVRAEGTPPRVSPEIELRAERTNRLLGTSLSADEIAAFLTRVGVACEAAGEGALRCRAPSHRNDLWLHQDLTEEVARIFGYDRIPTTEPVGLLQPVALPPLWKRAERARDALAGLGLVEVACLPFRSEAELRSLEAAAGDPRETALRVANPIREETPWLRTAVLPSLLDLVRQNRSRQLDRVRIFEVSRVFRPRAAGELPDEPLELAVAITAGEHRGLWEPQAGPPLFFEIRGIAERLLVALGYDLSLRGGDPLPYLHPSAAAGIEVGGTLVGALGEIHPEVASRFDLDTPCAVLELSLGALVARPPRAVRFREVSRQPRVQRDLAVIIDRDRRAGEVLAAIRKTAGADLLSADLFDRYEGKGVPEGRVSLAFRLVFQRADRTLTDAEVSAAIERVVRMLGHRFGGELR